MTYTVIGAGLIGLATAYTLARDGHPVTIIDPQPLSGASHHAAGMLAPTAEMVYQQDKLFPLMDDAAARYPGLLADLADHSDLPTGHNTHGTLIVAGDSADRDHLHQLAAYQHAHGHEAEKLSIAAARRYEPALSPAITGALRIEGDHQIDPRLLGAALIDALKKLGATFHTRPATHADLGENTICCAGLGAAEFFPDLPLRPVYGDIMRLKIPAHYAHTGGLIHHVIRGYVNDRPVYLVPRHDGHIVLGATSREDNNNQPEAGGVLDLLRDAAAIVPAIRDCAMTETTCGARPGTPDDLPLIGRDEATGTVISTGYFRHGILLTPFGAALGAAYLTGTEKDTFHPDTLAAVHHERAQHSSHSTDRLSS